MRSVSFECGNSISCKDRFRYETEIRLFPCGYPPWQCDSYQECRKSDKCKDNDMPEDTESQNSNTPSVDFTPVKLLAAPA